MVFGGGGVQGAERQVVVFVLGDELQGMERRVCVGGGGGGGGGGSHKGWSDKSAWRTVGDWRYRK